MTKFVFLFNPNKIRCGEHIKMAIFITKGRSRMIVIGDRLRRYY